MDYVKRKSDGRYYCIICEAEGKSTSYAMPASVFRHRKSCHGIGVNKGTSPKLLDKPVKVKVNCVAKAKTDTPSMVGDMAEVKAMISGLVGVVKDLQEQVASGKPPITNNIVNNVNNNVSIYFNKDLKYYPELVKLIGKKEAWDYLLFTMPETRDFFGVIDKLSAGGNGPIKVDGSNFIIVRGATEHTSDPTGELLDKENKSKLQDAVLSAYMDSTKDINDECEKIRRSRVGGTYTEADEAVMSKRFDESIEPSRPYQVIDIINGFKPKRKDFDRLRAACPKIEKKTVYTL